MRQTQAKKHLDSNITNELGVENRVRFIKNVAGLWMLEESIRHWRKEGHDFKVIDLVKEASTLGKSKSQVNARDTKYTKSGPIPEWIKDECRAKGIYVPESPAEIALLIFESLATAYKEVIDELQDASGIEVFENKYRWWWFCQ
jgi:rhamnulokinase